MIKTLLKYVFLLLLCFSISVFAGLFDNYQCKIKISFTGYAKTGALTNFPVLVILSTNITGFSYSSFKSNGNDLRFGDASETIELPYEVEKWDTNGQSYIWVRTPIVNSNSYIWAYWKKSNDSGPSYQYGSVWTNAIGIWHMHVLNAVDSSSNQFNGTAGANVSIIETGRIGKSLSFSGGANSSYFVTVPSNQAFQLTGNYTVSAWIYPKTNNQRRFVGNATSSSGFFLSLTISSSITNNLAFFTQSESAVTRYSNFSVEPNKWKHVSYVNEGANGYFYVDGKRVSSVGAVNGGSGSVLHLGNCGVRVASYSWKGFLDEIRIQNAAMSSNWIWACFVSQASNNLFCTYGPVRNNAKGSIFMLL